jgi:hypothetical protein
LTDERITDKKLSRRQLLGGAAAGAVALGAVAGAGKLIPRQVAASSDAPVASREFVEIAGAKRLVPAPAQTTDIFGNPSPTVLSADLVLVGFGSVGIPAAIEAFDAGVQNIIAIEKSPWIGGQGHRCGGALAGANTVVQEYLGIDDNFNDFYEYLLACGQGMVDPALCRSFATNDNVDWVINTLGGQPVSEWAFSLDGAGQPITPVAAGTKDAAIPGSVGFGLDYNGGSPYFELSGTTPVMRSHWFTGNPADAAFTAAHAGMPEPYANALCPKVNGTIANGGTGIFKTLNDAVALRNATGPGNITVMTQTTLTGLVASDGEVLGISAADPNGNPLLIEAKLGVVLGTGGWSGNAKMVQDYLLLPQSEFQLGKNPASEAIEVEEDGAGVLAAQAIGANTVNMAAGGGSASKAGFALTPLSATYTDTLSDTLGAGGLKINANSQVIDIDGDIIPRLYAGGRTTGGLTFHLYPVCGTDYGSAMWQGRVAGRNVATLNPWTA